MYISIHSQVENNNVVFVLEFDVFTEPCLILHLMPEEIYNHRGRTKHIKIHYYIYIKRLEYDISSAIGRRIGGQG